jgi:hypothetical protein
VPVSELPLKETSALKETPFKETSFKELTDPGVRSRENLSILEHKINELHLQIEGTRLEKLIQQLYADLEAKGLRFQPACYLSDEWGCPDGVPVIGIPFYLANPMLTKIEEDTVGDVEGDHQILMYLRHEAGHAYNYAYRLYQTEEWHGVFGPYTRPYVEEFRPFPFSKKFVRHIPGWYAQKHPDEDFAETFAVWLTPKLDWEQTYKEWPALAKLQYVDRVMRALPDSVPIAAGALKGESPVEEMNYTVREHYLRQEPADVSEQLGQLIDGDLRDLFGAPNSGDGEPVAKWIPRLRRDLVRDIGYWTGERPKVIGALLDHLAQRAGELGLVVPAEREEQMHVRFSIMVTTLVVNHLYRERFIDI